jgi:hypothetical protein
MQIGNVASNLCIVDYSHGMTGSTHDSAAFAHTGAAKYPDFFLMEKNLHGPIPLTQSTPAPSPFTNNQPQLSTKMHFLMVFFLIFTYNQSTALEC